MSYAPAERTVTWTAGDITDGQSKTVSFIVSILPSVSQVGSEPDLITNQRLTGIDRFVRKEINATAATIRTTVSSGAGTVLP